MIATHLLCAILQNGYTTISSMPSSEEQPNAVEKVGEKRRFMSISNGDGSDASESTSSDDDDDDKPLASLVRTRVSKPGADGTLYCLCRKRDDGRFMIGCDFCPEWYHGDCVGITKLQALRMTRYCCTPCYSAGRGPPEPIVIPKVVEKQRKKRKRPKRKHRELVEAARDHVLLQLKEIMSVELSASIEASLYAVYASDNDRLRIRDYKEKFMELVQNLKDERNPELCRRVSDGRISPNTFVRMTATELASQDLVAARQLAAEEQLKEVVKATADKEKIQSHVSYPLSMSKANASNSNDVILSAILSSAPATTATPEEHTPKRKGQSIMEMAFEARRRSIKVKDTTDVKTIVRRRSDGAVTPSLSEAWPTPPTSPDASSSSSSDDDDGDSLSSLSSDLSSSDEDAKHHRRHRKRGSRDRGKQPKDMLGVIVNPVKQKYLPSVWHGSIAQQSSNSVVQAAMTQIGGPLIHGFGFPSDLRIRGTIRLKAVEKFVQQLLKSKSRALVIVSLQCIDDTETKIDKLLEPLRHDNKAAVIDMEKKGVLMYVIPPATKLMSTAFLLSKFRVKKASQTPWAIGILGRGVYPRLKELPPYEYIPPRKQQKSQSTSAPRSAPPPPSAKPPAAAVAPQTKSSVDASSMEAIRMLSALLAPTDAPNNTMPTAPPNTMQNSVGMMHRPPQLPGFHEQQYYHAPPSFGRPPQRPPPQYHHHGQHGAGYYQPQHQRPQMPIDDDPYRSAGPPLPAAYDRGGPTAPTPSSGSSSAPPRCRHFFTKKGCRNGRNCRFSHVEQSGVGGSYNNGRGR